MGRGEQERFHHVDFHAALDVQVSRGVMLLEETDLAFIANEVGGVGSPPHPLPPSPSRGEGEQEAP